MHKKLINDLHNIAFGIVSSVGNYYANVEKKKKKHQGNLYLLPKQEESGKGKRKGGKNVQKELHRRNLDHEVSLSSKRRELEIKASR